MKIVIPNIQEIEILHNIAQCLETLKDKHNIEIFFWNTQHKSIIDMFDETHPDIIFLHKTQLDISFSFICKEFDFKYVIITDEELPTNLLKAPNAVISHPSLSHLFQNCVPIRGVAKVPEIHNAIYDKNVESEVLIHTTGIDINQDIYNILIYLVSNYNTKIIGANKVNLHNYLGAVNMFERANFIKSTRVFVDLDASDVWDAAYLRTAPVSLHNVHQNIFQCEGWQPLKHNIDSLLSKKLVRNKYIDQCYETVCNNNTTYHWVAEIFNKINEKNISDILLKYIKELIK